MDLTGAFFSIPNAEKSQEIFAFTWEGKQLTWTRLPQGFTTFQAIKQALVSALALGLPDYGKPFTLYVTESRGTAKAVLVQKFGPYKGTPYCIRAVAAAAELTKEVRTIVLGHPLVVKVLMLLEFAMLSACSGESEAF
uniref:Reverse transcriptase domain-containing protein n=1 Tax=Coturnix japonica TaxID=93934 RepID=A0A8C2Y8Q6_COTJA